MKKSPARTSFKGVRTSHRCRRGLPLALATAGILAGCGSGGRPTGVATDPPYVGPNAASPSSPQSSSRTVLTPLGLNVRQSPSKSAVPLATAGRATVLRVIGRDESNGGWLHVSGDSVTGWVSADPALTSPHRFQTYASESRGFDALYRDDWTFVESSNSVVFAPQRGVERISVLTGTAGSIPDPGGPGLARQRADSVTVCGITATLVSYDRAPTTLAPDATHTSAPPSASGGTPTLAHRAEVQVALGGERIIDVRFDHDGPSLDDFADFYNSMSVQAPQCRPAPATSPSASQAVAT